MAEDSQPGSESSAPDNASLEEQASALKEEVAQLNSSAFDINNLDEDLMLDFLYYLWMIWGDFQIYVVEPLIDPISPPIEIPPSIDDATGEQEYVYKIYDEGYRLSCSRGSEGIIAGHSLRKFYNTIEKIIALLVERLNTGGIDDEEEVRVAFYGHELGQRKAFESILNLQKNVVCINFEAGEWGDRFMKTVLKLVEQGYGAPQASPRTKYLGARQQ